MMENEFNKNYARLTRLAAFFVDNFIFWIIFLFVLILLINPSRGISNLLIIMNSFFVLYFIFFFLNAWMFKNFGGSIGKYLCGVKVIKENSNEYLNFNDYFFREYIAKLFSGALVFLGFIYIFFNSKSQAFHDLMSNTVVIRENQVKAIASLVITISIFFLMLFFFITKLDNDRLFSNIESHTKVLGAQTEYQIKNIVK